MQRRGVRRAGLFVACIAALLLVWLCRAPLGRAALALGIDIATGGRAAFATLDVGRTEATLTGVRFDFDGVTVLQAERLRVAYRLRDLLPGAARRFGLERVVAERPQIALVRRADGSFVLPGGAGAVGGAGRPSATGVPWRFALTVHRGGLTLVDDARKLSGSRRFVLTEIGVEGAVDTAGLTRYRGRGLYASRDRASPLSLAGRVDGPRGYAEHRLLARALPLAPLVNYFINTPAAAFGHADVRDVDLKAYTFPSGDGGGPGAYHVAGSALLSDASMHVPGLTRSATHMRGRIELYDGGIAAPALDAALGPTTVRLAGGLYDWSAPQFRLGVTAASDLAVVRSLFHFSQTLPLQGRIRLATFLEGPVGKPLVATRVLAPGLRYGNFPIVNAVGRVFYYDSSAELLGVRGTYAGVEVSAGGAIDLGEAARSAIVLAARGETTRVPYFAQAAPGSRADAQALLTGLGQRFEVRGAVVATGPSARAAGLLHVDAAGDGQLGPFEIERRDGGTLAGAFYLHRSAGESGFWLVAHDYAMTEQARTPKLPGVALVAPTFSGRLSGSLAGIGPPSRFRLAGRALARNLLVGTVRLASVSGDLAGALNDVRFANVVATGPWGGFTGRGAYAGQRLALEGSYKGDFARLRTFTGDLGALGPVAGPVALLIDPQRTIVQARGATSAGSTALGLPVNRLAGTIDARRNSLRIYGATAAVAGATAVASGALDGAPKLAFSIAGADGAGAVRASGLVPGRITAIGTLTRAGRGARFEGGVALAGTRFDGVALRGNGEVAFGKNRLEIVNADAIAGAAVGQISGSLREPGSQRASYDMVLRVPAAPLGPVAQAVAPRVPFLSGTLGASFRVRGQGARWSLAGSLEIPEGTLNGLGFEAFAATLAVDPAGLEARAGRVLVGSTVAHFEAGVRGPDATLVLDAPRADLADFNDFFDSGDTLGGRGRVEGHFSDRHSTVMTSADIAIAGLRYRRFELGNASAKLVSSGARVRGDLAFGGPSGTLATSGTLVLAQAPLPELLARSRFDGTAHFAGLDLGVWLPALGFQVPLAGRVDADATIAGRLADPDVKTTATLVHGSIGSLPVDRLVIGATSTLRRTTVSRAELQVPSLDATLSGSFGFGEHDSLALAVHAKSSNIGTLASRLALGDFGASGLAEADVKIDGTRALPRIAGGFDVEGAVVHGVSVPQALGQFSIHGRDIVLSGVEVNFATGTLALAGSIPLEIAPFGFGPPHAPVALEAAATNIDLASFAPLLPAGSVLAGRIDGRVGVAGTAGDPRLAGALTLAGGSLRTPAETIPLVNVEARLAFDNHDIRLQRLRATAGGGTLSAGGVANLPDLVHPSERATYDFEAQAQRVTLNFPAYGGGAMTGTLGLSRATGALPLVRGRVALSDATIPFSALLGAGVGSTAGGGSNAPLGGSAAYPDVALDLALIADRNVRVRSANVDIGAHGAVHAGGTSVAPVLAGGFSSTGGTLSYFNTVFRLLSGSVKFEPDLGVIPLLDARAITHVINPDPNTVRNAAGTADITLALSGPVNALSISLDSNPAYGRQQILGLLLNAPAFGASNLFGETAQNPTFYGSTSTAALSPSVVTSRNANGELSVAQEAFGIANAQFTRTLLAPFETTFAGALGLSNFNVNVDYTGNVGLSARKVLGKDVNAIYDTSFGYPYRQTFGFEVKPNEFEAAQVTVFETLGAYDLNSLTPTGFTTLNSKVRAAQPVAGAVGFSLSIQRLFP